MGPNIPEEVRGFGKLGRFCRAVLKYAISAHISKVIVERYPAGATANPTATLSPSPSGTTMRLKISAGGGGASTFPFQLIDASTADPLAQVRVRYGTVNSIAPDGMSSGDDPVFLIEVADGDSVYLHAVWDTSANEFTTLEILAGSPIPSDDTGEDGEYYLEIGSVAVNSVPATPVVTIAQSIRASQILSVCRNWFTNPATYAAQWAPD